MHHPSHTSFLVTASLTWTGIFKGVPQVSVRIAMGTTNTCLHAAGDDVQDELYDVCDIAAVDLAFAAIRSDAQLRHRCDVSLTLR